MHVFEQCVWGKLLKKRERFIRKAKVNKEEEDKNVNYYYHYHYHYYCGNYLK